MLCKDCEHFKITCQYENEYNWGEAICEKYNLITDFRSKKKFETLKCVEDENGKVVNILGRCD